MPSVAERMASDDKDRMMTSDDSDDRMTQVSRAAYLMVKGSIAEDLVTREELTEALQFAGTYRVFHERPCILSQIRNIQNDCFPSRI